MHAYGKIGIICLSILFLNGCLHTHELLDIGSDIHVCGSVARVDMNEDESSIEDTKAFLDEKARNLDVLLNCYLGPRPNNSCPDNKLDGSAACIAQANLDAVLTDPDKGNLTEEDKKNARLLLEQTFTNDDKNEMEIRAYRGHIITTILAAYGAFNAEGNIRGLASLDFAPNESTKGHALDVVERVIEAERMLRAESELFSQITLKEFFDQFDKHENWSERRHTLFRFKRARVIANVFKDSNAPTRKRFRVFARNLIKAVMVKDIQAAPGLVGDVAKGALKWRTMGYLGKGLIMDAKNDLQAVYDRPPAAAGKVTLADWKKWDDVLDYSCARLLEVAGKPKELMDCTPEK